ncbi:hypothetical protein MRX96_049955 [Rhipicephalus microplus]
MASEFSACRINTEHEVTSEEPLAALAILPLGYGPYFTGVQREERDSCERVSRARSLPEAPVFRAFCQSYILQDDVLASFNASTNVRQLLADCYRRLFHLKLRPDTAVFDKDLVVETATFGKVKPDIGHIYSGEVVGDPSSGVYGGLHKGVFEGSIQSRWGRFYVEGARKFFDRRMPFHSVMYAAEDAGIPPARVVRRQRRDHAMDAAAGRCLRTGTEQRV